MVNFNSILNAAQQLQPTDRLRLINALQDTVPPETESPFHEEWAPELERRVAAIEARETMLTPWSSIRDAALSRIRHGIAS